MIGTKIGDKHASDINYCIKPLSCDISRYSCQNLRNAEKWGSVIRNYLTLWRIDFSNIWGTKWIMGLKCVCCKARHRFWHSLTQTVLVEYSKSPKNIISWVKITRKSFKIESKMMKKSMIFAPNVFICSTRLIITTINSLKFKKFKSGYFECGCAFAKYHPK